MKIALVEFYKHPLTIETLATTKKNGEILGVVGKHGDTSGRMILSAKELQTLGIVAGEKVSRVFDETADGRKILIIQKANGNREPVQDLAPW